MYLIRVNGIELPTRTAVVEAIENLPPEDIELREINMVEDEFYPLATIDQHTRKLVFTNGKRAFFVTVEKGSDHAWYVPKDRKER
jgi:hypothetical protein